MSTQFGKLSILLDEDEDEISDEWREKLDIALREALPLMQDALQKHQTGFASLAKASSGSLQNPLSVLSQVISVLVVKDYYGNLKACFDRQAIAVSGPKYSHSNVQYCESRVQRAIIPTPDSASNAVEAVLRLLDLKETTTVIELDVLDPCFICMTCPVERGSVYREDSYQYAQFRRPFNWKDAVRLSDLYIRCI